MGKFELRTGNYFHKLGSAHRCISSHGFLSGVQHVPRLSKLAGNHRDVGGHGDLPPGAHPDVRLAHVVPQAECRGQEEIQES